MDRGCLSSITTAKFTKLQVKSVAIGPAPKQFRDVSNRKNFG